MSELDDQFDRDLRSLAHAARGSVTVDPTEVEHALADVTSGTQLTRLRPVDEPPRRAWPAWLAAAAATALVVSGGIYFLGGGDDRVRTVDPTLPVTVTSAPPIGSVPATTTPGSAPTAPSTTPAIGVATTTPSDVEPTVIESSVSWQDELPDADLVPVGEVTVGASSGSWLLTAVGDLGVAIRNGDEPDVHVVAWDGSVRDVPVPDTFGALAYGPGDVLYALDWRPDDSGGSVPDVFAVEFPLDGAAGTITNEAELSDGALRFVETSPSPLGHGRGGIVDRERNVDELLLPYSSGRLDAAPPTQPRIDHGSDGRGEDIVWAGHRYALRIDRHPDWSPPFTSPIPALAGADWAVYPTTLGAPLTDGDFPETDQPVIAVMTSIGEASWYSIPDGWRYATSDLWGTVFIRITDSRVEVALLADTLGTASGELTPADTVPVTVPTTTPTTVPAAPAFTEPGPLLEELSGRYEYSGIPRACHEQGWCTQVVYDPAGAPVSLDPLTGRVTRHLYDTGGPASFTLPGDGGLLAAGPGGVVYVTEPTDDPEFADAVGDVVAYSLTAGDAGREVARWPNVIGPGDSDLIPSPEGLALVGWYGQGIQPPAPFNIVVGWVDLAGQPITSPLPIVRSDFYEITIEIGDRRWTFADPLDGAAAYMPPVVPTFDGGFVAVYHHYGDGDGGSAVVRGWADGTTDAWVATDADPWMGLVPTPTGHVLVPNGNWFARADVFPAVRDADYWEGQRGTGSGDGIVATPGLDEFLDANDPWWEHDVVGFANAVAGPPGWPGEIRSIHVDAGGDVVVTRERLADDSVAGTQLRFVFVDSNAGDLRVDRIEATQRCQPERGHQDYQPAYCT